MNTIHRRKTDLFSLFIIMFFCIVIVVMMFPFWHTLMGSFMGQAEYYSKLLYLWPSHPTLENYAKALGDSSVWRAMINTVSITVGGTLASLCFTSFISYGLSKKFLGSKIIMQLIVLTMIINPGLIPNYLLLRKLHLINTYWVYILPALAYPFFIIIMRTYFLSLPTELEDASRIDGCNEFGHFFRIALPIAKPILATVGLFVAVNFWNTFSPSLFYISDESKKTLQEFLYRIVTEDVSEYFAEDVYFTDTVKMANIIIATLPILVVYPFVQKYFVKGLMIGAIKG